jgi:hypothetical protein
MKVKYEETQKKPDPGPALTLVVMDFVRVADGEGIRVASPGDLFKGLDADEFSTLLYSGRVALATEANIAIAQGRRKQAIAAGQIEK